MSWGFYLVEAVETHQRLLETTMVIGLLGSCTATLPLAIANRYAAGRHGESIASIAIVEACIREMSDGVRWQDCSRSV